MQFLFYFNVLKQRSDIFVLIAIERILRSERFRSGASPDSV